MGAEHECIQEETLERLHIDIVDVNNSLKETKGMIDHKIELLSDAITHEIPRINTTLELLRTGQDNIFKILGRYEADSKRVDALEKTSIKEHAECIKASAAAWKSKWQLLFASLMVSVTMYAMIMNGISTFTHPIAAMGFSFAAAIYGKEWYDSFSKRRDR